MFENIIENNAVEVTRWQVQFVAEIPMKNFVNILLGFLNGSRVAFDSPHFATCSLPYAGSEASRSTTDVKHPPAKRGHVFEHFRARAFKILFAFRSVVPSQSLSFDSDFNCPVARPRARRNGVGCARHFPSSQTFRSPEVSP